MEDKKEEVIVLKDIETLSTRQEALVKAGMPVDAVSAMTEAQINNLTNQLFNNTDVSIRKDIKTKEKENLERIAKVHRAEQIKLFNKIVKPLEQNLSKVNHWAETSGAGSFAIGEKTLGKFRYIVRIERKKDVRKKGKK